MSSIALEQDDIVQLQDSLSLLQKETNADLVLLGQVLTTPIMRIRTISCRLDQSWQPNFSYPLDTHPCQKVIDAGEFQYWEEAPTTFPQAFLLTDNRLHSYAGYPVSLDSDKPNGVLVIMSRTGWADQNDLRSRLSELAIQFASQKHTLADAAKHLRLSDAHLVRDEVFTEYVLDNAQGVSLSEFMPPLPIDLPEAQLMHRVLYSSFTVECNHAMARMCGYVDPAGMMGARAIDVHGPDKAMRNHMYWQRQNFEIRDVESQSVDGEGNITWTRGSAFGKLHDGKLLNAWVMRSDITAQKRYETAIQHKAHHDALTGLPNRYWFQDHIDALIMDHGARGKQFCVGLLDLNGFKEVNDTLGHAVGDLILQSVAKRLLKGLKQHGAEVARLGGDEFAILMPEVTDRQHAELMAQTVQQLLSEPFEVEDIQLLIGGSLGLAMFFGSANIGDDLLRLADVAMYASKNEGCAFLWYHPDIDKHSKRRLSLLSSLGSAIEHGEMFLAYQPKIDIRNGRVEGVEALIRWNHPAHGLIPPNDFIPFAETSEVIRPLTRWVLNESIQQAAAWQRNGHHLKIAVNISARNLLDEQLESYILECLDRHAFPENMLELEITESALMTRPAQAMDVLQSLRAHGISIAIDDFGTGYSSLAYLARLPVTTLKVDQTFVKDMVRSESDEQIVRSVIGLAHQCKLLVVAEGVEDEATLAALLGMHCDLAQGYLIAHPMKTEDASAWLKEHDVDSNNFSFLNEKDRERFISNGAAD